MAVSAGALNIGGGGGRIFIGGGDSGGANGFGTGTLTISGTGIVNVGPGGAFPNDMVYLAGYGGTGIINLNGGTLSTQRGIANGGSSTIHFNGGTLQAAASNAAFIAVTTAAVDSGGAIIDTQTFNVTIAQALVHGTGTLDGGLTNRATPPRPPPAASPLPALQSAS